MRHLHEYWSSVSYQGYSLPATAIAEKILSASSQQSGGSGGGGGSGEGCECKVTVTSNIAVGGIKENTRYTNAPISTVIKDLLTATLPSNISLKYSPVSDIESGVSTEFTFTTSPTNGSDPIAKQIITFPDGSTKEFNSNKSETFTKELTIISSTKITIKAETELKQVLSSSVEIKANLPIFIATSLDTRTDKEVEDDAPGPEDLNTEDFDKAQKIVKSNYKITYNIDCSDAYRWIWFYVPKNLNLDLTKATSHGDQPFPFVKFEEKVININGVNQTYVLFRSGASSKDSELIPVKLN